jgi:hypothetical protein
MPYCPALDASPRKSSDREYVRAAFQEIAAAMNAFTIEGTDGTVSSRELLGPILAADLPEARRMHSESVEVIVPVHQANTTSFILLGERRSGNPGLGFTKPGGQVATLALAKRRRDPVGIQPVRSWKGSHPR